MDTKVRLGWTFAELGRAPAAAFSTPDGRVAAFPDRSLHTFSPVHVAMTADLTMAHGHCAFLEHYIHVGVGDDAGFVFADAKQTPP